MPEKPVPQLLAMLICDSIIHDAKTGKKTLVGVFDNINVRSVPVTHPVVCVYIALTEGIGNYDGDLVLVREDDESTVCTFKGPLAFQDRLQRVELEFEINNISFPQFGKYRFDFLCDGRLVKSRKLYVKEIQRTKGKPDKKD